MHPSLRVLSSRPHQPLIKFLGKRIYPSTLSKPHPHPQAPPEVVNRFSDFVAKSQATEAPHAHPQAPAEVKSNFPAKKHGPTGTTSMSEFWLAPERLWKQDIEEAEIEAITSGGATLH
ncbi:putative ribosomal protein S36, mitochondrial [Lyophyllum shimeji]|uniref:Ribosomal protein S36, mitochondrial n=1 Tax=Lyophyllum shimeji TaxID=47721 RepID=A0A9P3UHU5_LYOSH|nr:putative ribosomal protein S36, mitochondrial [Lyophyllum shimeji]